MDQLADALVGLLRLAEDVNLVRPGVTVDGRVTVYSTTFADLLSSVTASDSGEGALLVSGYFGVVLVILYKGDAGVMVSAQVLA